LPLDSVESGFTLYSKKQREHFMSGIHPTNNKEVDLFEFFETLWNGKWKIIATTFVALLIGVAFISLKPNSFEVLASVSAPKESVVHRFSSINKLLDKYFYEKDRAGVSGYHFDKDRIFKRFISEFEDYEEMITTIGEIDYVKQSTKHLDDKDKNLMMIDLAKKFQIIRPSKEEPNWFLKFSWHDDIEGRRIFNDAISKTLINVKESVLNDINELARSIDFQNSLSLEKKYLELDLGKQLVAEKDKKRLQFLREHYSIAKKLNIEIQDPGDSKPIQTEDHYRLGYKAIKRELEIIENRTNDEKILMIDNYLKLKKEIVMIEKDLTSSHLRKAAGLIKNDNPSEWIQFDLSLADSFSKKNKELYFVISILLGGTIGIMYVLISNAVLKRKDMLMKS